MDGEFLENSMSSVVEADHLFVSAIAYSKVGNLKIMLYFFADSNWINVSCSSQFVVYITKCTSVISYFTLNHHCWDASNDAYFLATLQS